jgi:hypothetical protein
MDHQNLPDCSLGDSYFTATGLTGQRPALHSGVLRNRAKPKRAVSRKGVKDIGALQMRMRHQVLPQILHQFINVILIVDL